MAFKRLSRFIRGKFSKRGPSSQSEKPAKPEGNHVQGSAPTKGEGVTEYNEKQQPPGGATVPKQRFTKRVKKALNKLKKRLVAFFSNKFQKRGPVSGNVGENEKAGHASIMARIMRRAYEYINMIRGKVQSLTGDGKVKTKPKALQKKVRSMGNKLRNGHQQNGLSAEFMHFLDTASDPGDIDPSWYLLPTRNWEDYYGFDDDLFIHDPDLSDLENEENNDRLFEGILRDAPYGGLFLDPLDDDLGVDFDSIYWGEDTASQIPFSMDDTVPELATTGLFTAAFHNI